jgi:5-methylcytosine-specific restriction endonuclease McrA
LKNHKDTEDARLVLITFGELERKELPMTFNERVKLQGQRCQWCQRLIPAAKWTRDHIFPKKAGARERFGSECVMACETCNRARSALTIGSIRFEKWLRRVLRGDVRPFIRRETFVCYGPS